ncbi:MAG: restriction endonuclease [Lentimicrobiaceae bacterium]|nr:restriction endonuclease [Lentimicrobiaceae bacterium]
MTTRVENKKWILYRHTRNFHLLCEVAKILKSYSKTTITKKEKERLNLRLKELNLYNERNLSLPLDAINHKINQLSYYMFGYQTRIDGVDRFMFSPLGNLLLKNINKDAYVPKIFLTMLWAVQYTHPHGGTDGEFQLYPFRLIYKLLLDDRLKNRLYAYEVAYSIVFTKEINNDLYEKLVVELLRLRKLSNAELTERFQKNPHAYVNAAYEWDYYVSTFFQEAGVLEKVDGELICKLQHGNTKTFRKVTRNYVLIPKSLMNFTKQLLAQYRYDEIPLRLNDEERLREDVVKEIYSFYPQILLDEIGESSKVVQLLNLPKLIEEYSNNPEGETSNLFEEVLVQGFNMFYNIAAKHLGGAGHTDIECLYLTRNKKFAVESKSTANKLIGINVGRLRGHREEIGGRYTIIITPRYVPAARRDIIGTPNVIILASTFAEFLYNCIDNDLRKIDYEDFDKIIEANLGNDVSQDISNMTISKFGMTK